MVVAAARPIRGPGTPGEGIGPPAISFAAVAAPTIPKVAEPWFLAFNAKVTAKPAMIADDLAKAEPAIAAAGKKYS